MDCKLNIHFLFNFYITENSFIISPLIEDLIMDAITALFPPKRGNVGTGNGKVLTQISGHGLSKHVSHEGVE